MESEAVAAETAQTQQPPPMPVDHTQPIGYAILTSVLVGLGVLTKYLSSKDRRHADAMEKKDAAFLGALKEETEACREERVQARDAMTKAIDGLADTVRQLNPGRQRPKRQ